MTILEVATLLIFIPYLVVIASLAYGWNKARQVRSGVKPAAGDTRISVIIALRNEAEQVDRLFEALALQDYPAPKWEVIAVDDHSEDSTLSRLQGWHHGSGLNLKILQTGSDEAGKKAALSRGIGQARGELIVTTDADCRMGSGWLTSLAAFYERNGSHLIFGPVLFEEGHPRIFTRLQSLEFLTLMATAAGSSQLGHPVFCNAANMAFPRQLYNRLNDPLMRDLASGDDTMLLLKVKKMDPARVAFNPDPECQVLTQPMARLGDFWNQRKRWASKSRHYRDPDILVTGGVVMMTNFWLLFLFTGSPWSQALTSALPAALAAKMAIDALLIWPAMKHFNKRHLWRCFIPGQLLYPVYSSLSALAGRLSGFTWKNRRYHVN